jgi:hypothetical protein
MNRKTTAEKHRVAKDVLDAMAFRYRKFGTAHTRLGLAYDSIVARRMEQIVNELVMDELVSLRRSNAVA